MAPVNRYSATVHREGDWWVIDVDGVGATQAKRLDKVEHMARDLVAAVYDVDYDDVEVDVSYRLTPLLDALIDGAKHATEEAHKAQARATELSREAAAKLRAAGMSLRDIARLTGVSFQRVHQLVAEVADAGSGEAAVRGNPRGRAAHATKSTVAAAARARATSRKRERAGV
jgi:hypothetical protein